MQVRLFEWRRKNMEDKAHDIAGKKTGAENYKKS